MDKSILFTNGSVFDGRAFLPQGTSVLVSGGRVTDVSATLQPRDADIVDLDGGTLLPGFIDAHAHPVFGGMQLRGCDLGEAGEAEGYLAIVKRFAEANPDREWITGGGWSMPAFPGGIPTRQALDGVVADRPVFLQNRDGHGAWVNSRALELAGIDARTPDPAGRPHRAGRPGRAGRDAPGGRDAAGVTAAAAGHGRRPLSRAARRAAVPAVAGHNGLAGRDRRPRLRRGRRDERLPAGGAGRHAPRQRRRRAVVAAAARTRTARGTAAPPRGRRRPPVPSHQREDDAGRRRGKPHRRDARSLPRRARLRHR